MLENTEMGIILSDSLTIYAHDKSEIMKQQSVLNSLFEDIYNTAKDKGWWDPEFISADLPSIQQDERKIPEKLALIHSEVSEALECYRKDKEPYYIANVITDKNEGTVTIDEKPCGIVSELADVIIRCADTCEHYWPGLLSKAILEKIAYNKTRSFRHGGKKC